jgi:SagB-type dehydrogenase family enzyme
MNSKSAIIIGCLAIASLLFIFSHGLPARADSQSTQAVVHLPEPDSSGKMTVEQALSMRRSVRKFAEQSISMEQLSQLLWSAQGITDKRGLRTAPSAGALYPLELYIVAKNIDGLASGIYKYMPDNRKLTLINQGGKIEELSQAAGNQSWITDAAAVVAITGVYERTAAKYGDRAIRYVNIETGCAAENIYLQATAIGLGTTLVGAFADDKVTDVLGLKIDEYPLALMPVGYPAK